MDLLRAFGCPSSSPSPRIPGERNGRPHPGVAPRRAAALGCHPGQARATPIVIALDANPRARAGTQGHTRRYQSLRHNSLRSRKRRPSAAIRDLAAPRRNPPRRTPPLPAREPGLKATTAMAHQHSRECQPACKPGSVWRLPSATAIHLGRRLRGASSDQPGWRVWIGTWRRKANLARPATPIWSCSRWGLPCRSCCQARGALLPHRFTLAATGKPAEAVSSLWHSPWGCPRRPLAATVGPWSPDFPLPLVVSPQSRVRRQRPSGRLADRDKGHRRPQVKPAGLAT